MRFAPGTLDEQARRLAAVAALDRSARRIRSLTTDLQFLQTPRTHDTLVQGEMCHDDGPIESERVERVAVR